MKNQHTKMRVGILTFHKAKNYGAVLQAFALQTTLKNNGIDALIIDRYSGYKTIIHKLYYILHPKFIYQRFSWILFDQFSRKNIKPRTIKYKTISSLKDFNRKENFDAVIVGSDQVWRMEFSQIGYNYFFDFIKDVGIRKISYAASFGKDKWEEDETTTIKVSHFLKDFNSISVRENSGVKICTEFFNLKATQVIDPTLLLGNKDYESILMKNFPKKNNNKLVSYILGNKIETLKYCNIFAKNNELDYTDLYYTNSLCSIFTNSNYGKKKYFHIPVPKWLAEIRDAKYLITNSFHATIFAIIFGKQFIVVDHISGGTDRIKSLLELVGLQDRFVLQISDISLSLFQKPIDYETVYSKIEIEKERSIQFLKDSLFL